MTTREQILITQQQIKQQQSVAADMITVLEKCSAKTYALSDTIRSQFMKTQCSYMYTDNIMRLQAEIQRVKQQADEGNSILKQLESDLLAESQAADLMQRLLYLRLFISSKYARICVNLLRQIDRTFIVRGTFYLQKYYYNAADFQLPDCDISRSVCCIQFGQRARQKYFLVETVKLVFRQAKADFSAILLVLFYTTPLYPQLLYQHIYRRQTHFLNFFSQFVYCEGMFVQRTQPLKEVLSKSIKQPKISNLLYYYLAKTLNLHTRFQACYLEKEPEYSLCIDTGINIAQYVAEIYAQSKQAYKNMDFKQRSKLIACQESKLSNQVKNQLPVFSYQQETHFLQFAVVQFLYCFKQEFNYLNALLTRAVYMYRESAPECKYDDELIQKQVESLALAIASEILCSSALYISYLIQVYAKQAEDLSGHQFCIYDLVQTFNVFIYIQNEYVFCSAEKGRNPEDIVAVELQYLADIGIAECQENLVSQAYFNLNNQFTGPSNFIAYLFVVAYYQIFYTGKLLFDKFDQYLFPSRLPSQNMPIVAEQAAIVLNQLQKMIAMTRAVKILNPKLYMLDGCAQAVNGSLCQIPYYRSSASAGIIEQRVYYLLFYLMNNVQVRDNAMVNLLQKITTFSFVADYLADTAYSVGQCISNDLKSVIAVVVSNLIKIYSAQVWGRLQKVIRIASLCVAMRHAYDKWLAQNCISQAEYEKVMQQLEIYERQRKNKYGNDAETMSSNSKQESPDADYQSDSGSSVYSQTNYYNDANKVYSRLKSKTLQRAIVSAIESFNQQITEIFNAHRGFYVQNKDVKKQLAEGMSVAVAKYELFQSVCGISAVSQKYLEQSGAFPADDLDAKCRELFQ